MDIELTEEEEALERVDLHKLPFALYGFGNASNAPNERVSWTSIPSTRPDAMITFTSGLISFISKNASFPIL
jgi:hypothetical protein